MPKTKRSERVNTRSTTHSKTRDNLLRHLHVGDRVEVYWPIMKQYYPGKVAERTQAGRHRIEYDDGDIEVLQMEEEQWRFCDESAERIAAYILGSMKKERGRLENVILSSSHMVKEIQY